MTWLQNGAIPSEMEGSRFAKLTTRQRESLRLYHQRYRIKSIAEMLAISPNTVGSYLTEATAVLDAGGREAAAAALVAHEAAHPEARGRFSVGDGTLNLPDAGPEPSNPAPAEPAAAPPTTAWLPYRTGPGNDLSIGLRFVWLAAFVFAAVAGFGAFALFVRTVSDIVRAAGG